PVARTTTEGWRSSRRTTPSTGCQTATLFPRRPSPTSSRQWWARSRSTPTLRR
ncbi:unnamed protein product, partial [Heterosigma akashiwo]